MTESWQPIDDRFPRLYWRLDDAAWQAFQSFGMARDVADGEVIFMEGGPSISLVLVIQGELMVSRGDQEIARVAENYSVGEMGLLLDMPRGGTVTASRPSKILELTREDILRMQQEAPIWSTRLYRVLAECLADYLHRCSGGPKG
jgi:CRP-like cAMP-binding protein